MGVAKMDEEKKGFLKIYFQKCYERLELGEAAGGDRYKSLDLLEEISNELADISNYAFLEYLKLMKLKEKINAIEKSEG
jgi:hypothetical protein